MGKYGRTAFSGGERVFHTHPTLTLPEVSSQHDTFVELAENLTPSPLSVYREGESAAWVGSPSLLAERELEGEVLVSESGLEGGVMACRSIFNTASGRCNTSSFRTRTTSIP